MTTPKIILALGFTVFLFPLFSQEREIKVIINNVRDDVGTVWVALHQPGEEYMKVRYMWFKVQAQKGTVSGIFKDVPDGTYEISIMHDFNNNRE
jgi:uncharacterized protein (DUF2141 family)